MKLLVKLIRQFLSGLCGFFAAFARNKKLLTTNILKLCFIFSFLLYSCKNESKKVGENPITKEDAAAKLNREIAEQPTNAELYFQRAQLFAQKSNLRQAFDDINKAVMYDSTKYDYYMLLADVSFKGLQIQKTLPAFQKAISLQPERYEAHLKLSELYLYLKAYKNCIGEANEALRIDKSLSKAYFIKGFAYKEMADTGKAVSSFQTAVEINPSYYDAYIQLGNIEAAGKHAVAIQYYSNALRIQPSSTEALYNRGLLFQDFGQLDKATEDYKNILKIDNSYPDAHYNLGYIALVFKKDYKSAIEHFTNAIKGNDQYAEAYYNRGISYEKAGDKEAALKDFRKAVDVAPTFKLAKEKLSQSGVR